jgi:hypothetical protein
MNEHTDAAPVWLGLTPTGHDLEAMPGEWFHAAIDKLFAETVPKSYWDKVVTRQQAKAWDVK